MFPKLRRLRWWLGGNVSSLSDSLKTKPPSLKVILRPSHEVGMSFPARIRRDRCEEVLILDQIILAILRQIVLRHLVREALSQPKRQSIQSPQFRLPWPDGRDV